MNDTVNEHSTAPENSPALYFVDGYHGGLKGHMPQGSVADILNGLDKIPDWKVSLEIEPLSFDYLKKHEPETFYRLKEYVEADYDKVRAEIVTGAHAQAFSWAVSGESVIRQLTFGKKLVKESFPGAVVDTYAVQEPCWTSALPQILNSLGFKRAVLKNSTCWGGYTAGVDKEILFWVGPDGSRIACVPRYACEDLVLCWAIQGSGYDKAAMDVFAAKCLRMGIAHPVGVEFQDLGWRGLPWINEKYQVYTTWREYFDKIADKPSDEWHFSQEDILVTLPWGERTINRMSRQVRESENRIISAEKLASVAAVKSGYVYPESDFEDAWDQLLLSQHHDAWICAPCGSWAKRAEFQTSFADNSCSRIVDDALWALQENETDVCPHGAKTQYVRVFNTSGNPRRGIVETTVTLPDGTESVSVEAPDGSLAPSRLSPIRRPRGNCGSFRLSFEADVPAMGFSSYILRTSASPAENADVSPAVCVSEGPDEVKIENDIYSIVIDLKRGGTFSSLVDKRTGAEYVSREGEYLFNEYRGYFIGEKRYFSTKDSPVTVKTMSDGGLRATVILDGDMAGQHFRTFVTLEKGCEAIRLRSQFFFFKGTQVGNPLEIPRERNSIEYNKADHDDRYKLHALFPTSFNGSALYKESAFNVEKSRHEDTFFTGWDKIKHKVLVHWVDSCDEQSGMGLTLFCDHTTSYLHGRDYPLGLTLAYGGQSGFWWGNCMLDGLQESCYSLIPHTGKWDEAGIYSKCQELCEPFETRTFSTSLGVERVYSSMSVDTPGVILSSVYMAEGKLLVRIFNAEGTGGTCSIRTGFDFSSVAVCAPDGSPANAGERASVSVSGRTVSVTGLPRFGICTLSFGL